MKKYIKWIIKVGNTKYMQPFFENGEIYFNTLESFKRKDENQERFDIHEGAESIEQITWIKMRDNNGREFQFSKHDPSHIHLSSAYLITNDDSQKGNLYSCTAVTMDTANSFKRLDPRFQQFGDAAVLIHNPNVFTTRIEEELKKQGYNYLMGLVKYYDPDKENGPLHLFLKKHVHSYQSELRIWIENSDGKPVKINIGSIKDIAGVFKIEDLMKL